MAVPFVAAVGLATRLFRKLPPVHSSDIGAFILGTVGVVGSYLGYESSEPPSSDSTIPTSKPSKSLPVLKNLSVKDPIKTVLDTIKSNSGKSLSNVTTSGTAIESTLASIQSQVADLASASSESPLLMNQVGLVDALHSISLGIEAQAMVLASIFETLDNNLGGLVAISSINAQNNKVSGDYLKQSAANGDYGDNDFFYAFKPTSEYWHDVDVATQNQHMETSGSLDFLMFLPSSFYAPSEIDLIDSMQKNSSKSEIRKAVEDFRVSHVGSDIRARLGVALVQSQAKTTENTKAQTDFYKAETSAIKAREIAPSSTAGRYGPTAEVASANALASLATALAPVKDWAELAKVREEYLQTSIDLTDMDGNVLATAKPMEMATTKDAVVAREKTDINTMEYTRDLFPESMFDSLPVIPFIGRESVFDKDAPLPSMEIFFPKILQ